MKKILFVINESEKERILDMHKSASKRHYLSEKSSAFKTLNEQFNQTNGIYTTKKDQALTPSIDFNTQHPNKIPAGTKIYHDYNNKSNTKIILGNTGVIVYCDRNVFIYNDSIDDLKNDGFMNVIKSVFCNGNKLKTWDQLTNKDVKQKVKTITGGGGTSNLKVTEFPEIKVTPPKLQGNSGTTPATVTPATVTPATVTPATVTPATVTPATVTPPPLQGVVDTTNMASRRDIRQGYRQGKRDVRELKKELNQHQNTIKRMANKMTPEQRAQYDAKIAQLQTQINQSAS
jgi:hypothetical protein